MMSGRKRRHLSDLSLININREERSFDMRPEMKIAIMALLAGALGTTAFAGTPNKATGGMSGGSDLTFSSDYPTRLPKIAQNVVPITHTPLLQPVSTPYATAPEGQIVIQVGAFSVYGNAARMAEDVSGYGPTRILQQYRNGQTLYRVYVGRFTNRSAAMILLRKMKSEGHNGFITTRN